MSDNPKQVKMKTEMMTMAREQVDIVTFMKS